MMEPHIKAMLEDEQMPENISKLLEDIRVMLRYSRTKMCQNWNRWDHHLKVFQGFRIPDEEDMEAREMGEPEKSIIPMSYSQIMTGVTFTFLLYLQNETFFELRAGTNAGFGFEEVANRILQRDLQHNYWTERLYQSLIDLYRFGLTALKSSWKVETMMLNVAKPQETSNAGPFQTISGLDSITEEVLKYEGNEVTVLSPYRLIPDLRLPLTRWREGRFICDEMEYHIDYLHDLERKGVLAGTKWVTAMDKQAYLQSERGMGRFQFIEASFDAMNANNDPTDFMCIQTEGQFRLIPKKYGLGDEDYPVDFIINMANDQRITRVERAGNLHGEFIYDLAQFSPDVHMKINNSLSDTINALQQVVTWLINARIMSTRQALDRHLIVHPQYVDTVGLEQRSPIVYMRKNAPATGIANFIQQLTYRDNTATHFQDADVLTKIMQTITGVNENAMGQYAPGRRSAAENRAANAGAASRMKLYAQMAWDSCYGPLGKKMLINSRQALSWESFQKIIGDSPTPEFTLEQLYTMYAPTDPRVLVGNEDFFVFDGTLQSEKTFLAQSLQELVIAMMQNPETMQLLQFDVGKMIDEIQYLKGVNNVARFRTDTKPTRPLGVPAPTVASAPGVLPITAPPTLTGGVPPNPSPPPVQGVAAGSVGPGGAAPSGV